MIKYPVKVSFTDDVCVRSARTEVVKTKESCYYLVTLQRRLWGDVSTTPYRDAVIAHECAHIEMGHIEDGGDLPLDNFIKREIEADTHSILSGKTTPLNAMTALRLASTDKEWEVYCDPTSNWGKRLLNLVRLSKAIK